MNADLEDIELLPPEPERECHDEPAFLWPSLRTVGIVLMIAGGIAFTAFTLVGLQRSSHAIERTPPPTPAELEPIVNSTDVWQQRSAAVSAVGFVLLVASQVRARRARA